MGKFARLVAGDLYYIINFIRAFAMNLELTKALEVFQTELCSWKTRDGQLEPLPCRIHDVFKELGEQSHNCIGCNFASAITAIERVLKRIANTPDFDPEFDYADYLLSLYLFVERACTLLDIISVPDAFRHRHFGVFQEIRRWANFLKHPNYFLLVHHPMFQAGGCVDDPKDWEQIVDTEFVVEHYGHDARSKSAELRKSLMNKTKVLVLFPDIVQFTERFCGAVETFVSLIVENPVYREQLDDIATYANYFDTPRTPST